METNPWLIAASRFATADTAEDLIPGWTPQPKQAIAEHLSRSAEELLYGGATYSGKTDWGLQHVIQECARHYGNRGLILRRVWPSLRRDVLPRLLEKLKGIATYQHGSHTFVFPNGSTIELGHVANADSWTKYQGGSYGVIFFEELTEFLETQYEALQAWVRVPPGADPTIRPHVIATTNPGGVGHRWVKNRFVRSLKGEKHPINKVWRPEPNPDVPDPTARAYVPATSTDNPIGMERDPKYMQRVRGAISNRGLRKAMESGDWDAIDMMDAALWQYEWLDLGRVEEGHLAKLGAVRKAVACDPSEGDEEGNAFGLWGGGMGKDGAIYTTHSKPIYGTTKGMAREAIELYHEIDADVMFIEKNHGGKWMESVFKQIDPYVNIELVWASEGKITRAEPIAAMFEPDVDSPLLYRARLEGFHVDLETELCNFTGGPGEASPNILDALVWGHKGLSSPPAMVKTMKQPARRIMAGAPGRMRV